ncbi:MAG: hypothetical protein DRN17_05795, partial [Thermoplasmata archaeon]
MSSFNQTFTVTVTDNGTYRIATNNVRAHTAAMNQGSAAASRAHAEQEGLTEGATHATRAFDKQLKGLGGGATGLIQLYGGLAANAFAVTAAFRALSNAADYQNQIKAAEDYALRTGMSLMSAAKSMRAITGDAISMSDALRHSSIAAAAGFNTSEIEKLTTVAKKASLALGRNLADSLERVFKGAVKAEPELLDELGIILRLKPATEKYAESIGKTASELTTFEKQQAVLNEVLAQGEEKFGGLSDAIAVNPYAPLAAAASDLMNKLGSMATVVILPFVELLSSSPTALTAAVGLFAYTIMTKALPSLALFGTSFTSNILAKFVAMANLTRTPIEIFNDQSINSLDSYTEGIMNLGVGMEHQSAAFLAAGEDYENYRQAGMSSSEALQASTSDLMANTSAMGIHGDEQAHLVDQLRAHTAEVERYRAVADRAAATSDTFFGRIRAGVRTALARFAPQLDRIRDGFIGLHTAAGLGGMVGFRDSVRIFTARGMPAFERAMTIAGVAIRDSQQNLTGFGRVMESMITGGGGFGAAARAVGIFAGAMSGLMKVIPIIGQLFMVWEMGKMILDKV